MGASARALPLTAITASAALACNPDWDSYDPRLSGASSAGSTSGLGGGGGQGGASGGSPAGGGMGGEGAGGSGGAGGSIFCEPAAVESCYEGPPGTSGVGLCEPGKHTCGPDGHSYGPCEGEVTPTSEACGTAAPADENCNGVVNENCSLWSKRFGSPNDQAGLAIAIDGSGNIVLAGAFSDTIDFGGGSLNCAGARDIFVAKLGPSGIFQWAKRYGDAMDQQALGLAVDSAGSVIVTGSFRGALAFGGPVLTSEGLEDIFVVKLTADGAHAWSRSYGDGEAQTGRAVAVDPSGRVLVAGEAAGTVGFDAANPVSATSGKDGFLLSLDADGNHQWSKLFGGLGDDAGLGLFAAADGGALLTGYFSVSAAFGGKALVSGGGLDVFVAKLDAAGAEVLSTSFPAASDQRGVRVAETAAGDIVLLGDYAGTLSLGGASLSSAGAGDIFVAKLTAAGGHVWSQGFGDAAKQEASAMALNASSDVLVIGSTQGVVNFGGYPLASAGLDDSLVFKLNGGNGSPVWARAFGDVGEQRGRAVATDALSSIYITGEFSSKVDFGSGELASAGGKDLFLAKLPP